MTDDRACDLLSMLLVDLQRTEATTTPAQQKRLIQYLKMASAELERFGIELNDSIDDDMLIVSLASHFWTNRDTGAGIPRGIRYRMNNRLFSQKTKG